MTTMTIGGHTILAEKGYADMLSQANADKGTYERRTIDLSQVHAVPVHPVQISAAAQTAYQTGTTPAADSNGINIALLKAAAQRRLGRPFD